MVAVSVGTNAVSHSTLYVIELLDLYVCSFHSAFCIAKTLELCRDPSTQDTVRQAIVTSKQMRASKERQESYHRATLVLLHERVDKQLRATTLVTLVVSSLVRVVSLLID